MLAHREENELLSKAMVSSVSLRMYLVYIRPKSFPGGSDDKESACNAGDPGLNPGSGRPTGKGNGNTLQYFSLEEFHGQRSLVGYSPWGHKDSDTTNTFQTKKENILLELNTLVYK